MLILNKSLTWFLYLYPPSPLIIECDNHTSALNIRHAYKQALKYVMLSTYVTFIKFLNIAFMQIKQTEINPLKVNSIVSNHMCYQAKSIFASSWNHYVYINANNHERLILMDVFNEYFMCLLIIKFSATLCQKAKLLSSLVLHMI